LSTEDEKAFTVVGVVGHVASSRATEDWPHVFLALRQQYWPRITIVTRGAADATSLVKSIQSSILAIEPGLPIPAVVTSESLVARGIEGQRAGLKMTAGLGLLALLLSAIGVYGVVAYAVSNRTREIGLRMAMGATQEQILCTVLGDAVRLSVPALLVGALLAAGTAIAMRSELLGVGPLDPISFGTVAGLIFLVVLLASLVPARRASGIHPMDALRFE
jgi:ABC-type antimicrobial peptide transport system permease subunit